VFRWKSSKKKQFFDEDLKETLRAMERHHEFYVLSIDSIERVLDWSIASIDGGANDITPILETLEKSFSEFRSNFRAKAIGQDATLSTIKSFLERHRSGRLIVQY
jgi:hypothetical protein